MPVSKGVYPWLRRLPPCGMRERSPFPAQDSSIPCPHAGVLRGLLPAHRLPDPPIDPHAKSAEHFDGPCRFGLAGLYLKSPGNLAVTFSILHGGNRGRFVDPLAARNRGQPWSMETASRRPATTRSLNRANILLRALPTPLDVEWHRLRYTLSRAAKSARDRRKRRIRLHFP